MAKKIIRLTESELNEVVKDATLHILNEKMILNEMPYERSDFVYDMDKDARFAYLHLAKLLLYKNRTNDANKWINDTINNFTLPMLTAKVYVSKKARSKAIYKGYIENFFGKDFVDYEYQMENFCDSAIRDMEDKAKKDGREIPQHDDIVQSMRLGKNIVIEYANKVVGMANGVKQGEANAILQSTIRNETNKAFGLNI